MFSYSNGVMLFSTNRKKVLSQRFQAQNLSMKNGENNGLLAGVPFLSPSCALRAQNGGKSTVFDKKISSFMQMKQE